MPRLVKTCAQLLAVSNLVLGYANILPALKAREITVRQARTSYDYIVVGAGQES